jgi:hypothetical protein
MEKIKIEKIEDIYPITIVSMRFGGKFVILNATTDAGSGSESGIPWADSIQGDEEVYYRINEWLEENVSPCNYGIGNSLGEAFEDYKKRYYGDVKGDVKDELIQYLESEFDKKFTYEMTNDPVDFTTRIKLFADDIYIGTFSHPEELYNDICVFFGQYPNNEFYQNVIKLCNIQLPTEFANAHDFAINEVKYLFKDQIKKKLCV